MKTITRPAEPATAPQAPDFESERAAAQVNELKEAVRVMDALAQEGFGQISAIAKLALAAMEAPCMAQQTEVFAQAFEAIIGRAETMPDYINDKASEMGAASKDKASYRRAAAWYEAEQERNRILGRA